MENFYKGLNRSNTDSYKWDIALENKPEGTLPFWIADSDYPTYEGVIDKLTKRVKEGAFGYTILTERYRNTLCSWYQRRYGYKAFPSDLIFTFGVIFSLNLIIKSLTKENDNILVCTPVYNPFYNVILKNKRTLVTSKLLEKDNTYVIDFSDFEEKIKKSKMFILCNPHNPIGRVWTKEEVDKIVKLCKKNDCILVSDEIHCDIVYSESKLNSACNYFEEYEKIVVCNAPSKTFNIAGLMNSTIIVRNKEYKKLFEEMIEDMSLECPTTLSLTAGEAAYYDGDNWVDTQNKYLEENRNIVYDYFAKNLPMCKVYKLEGTYLMWINMSKLGLSQENLISGLLKHKVQVNSGTVYSDDYKGYIRFNIACGREQLLKGLEYIAEFVQETLGK